MLEEQKKFDLFGMLEAQRAFQSKEMKRIFPNGYDVDALHHSLCSHMIAECQELMDCRPWMLHKKPPAMSKYTTTTEMVDVFKFLLNLMILHGVTPTEFSAAFNQKSLVVEDRIRTEVFVRSRPGPVLVCDLDGVLVDRDSQLLEFIRKSTEAPEISLEEAKKRIGPRLYERYKYQFYDSDSFYNCKPYPDAVKMYQALKKDIPVVILTARDVKRHAGIHYYTLKWLRDNFIEYDALIFYEEKDKALVGWCDPQSIAIDDEERQVERMNRICDAWKYDPNDRFGHQMFANAFEELRNRRNAAKQ